MQLAMRGIMAHSIFVDLGPGTAKDIASPIYIGLPFKADSNKPASPYPEQFIAIWDTGAQATTISTALAGLLKLPPMGQTRVHGVTGLGICSTYLVSIHLPNGLVIPELEVSDCPEDIGCDVLIGMDIIAMGDFAINNFGGNTTFTFRIPSLERLNFTTQHPTHTPGGSFIERKS